MAMVMAMVTDMAMVTVMDMAMEAMDITATMARETLRLLLMPSPAMATTVMDMVTDMDMDMGITNDSSKDFRQNREHRL